MITRREFLSSAAAVSLVGATRVFAETPALMSAARIGQRDGGALWRQDGFTSFDLPGRGHAMARRGASHDVMLVGRRPGTFAAIVDSSSAQSRPRIFAPAKDCRFAGHAAFAPDVSIMVTSEFDAASMQGVLVVRDAVSGEERAHISPAGIEPHELLFAKDGSRLVVALGGLIKDGGVSAPAFNPGGIDSSVVEIDPHSGRILMRHKLAPQFASLSLRHLALAPDGEHSAIAMQDQDLTQPRPLTAVLKLGGDIELLPLPAADECDFRGYVGSIAFDISGEFIAATSPRGGVVGVWSMSTRKWLGGMALPDACGLAAGTSPGEFWATSGYGDVVNFTATMSAPIVNAKWQVAASFDNHVLRI
ncbi:MAG TPA: DUF1513 domain-containing protein [Rhizomicrobium sp.]|nr:DUF1513 domain-containing protein [Rhizomicrobium sp.]